MKRSAIRQMSATRAAQLKAAGTQQRGSTFARKPAKHDATPDDGKHDVARTGRPKRSPRRTNAPAPVEQLAITRAAGWCEIGGEPLQGVRGRDWSIQHRLARGMGGTRNPNVNTAAALIVACGDGTTGCHGYIEAHPAEATENGWKVRHGVLAPAEVPVLLIHAPEPVWLADDGSWSTTEPEGAAA